MEVHMSKQIKVALLMAASLFMEIMDGTIVTTALPSMARAMRVQSTTASLLISSYMITVAICIPLSGWISQHFGQRRIWLVAVLGFTLSSLGNALAVNFIMLLLMRVLQGVFGSLMTPTARIIVLEKTESSRLLQMTSYLIWPALVAPAIAPVAGGAILAILDWRWIFLINLPIGIVIWLIGTRLIDQDTNFKRSVFDVKGFLAIAIMSATILGSLELGTYGKGYTFIALFGIGVGIVAAIIGYRHLRYGKNVLFSLSAFSIQSFRVTQTSGVFLWLSVGAMPYLLTTFLQNIFRWSALKAGTYVLFIFLGNISSKPFTTPMIRGLGYRKSLLIAYIAVAFSAFGLVFIMPSTPAVAIWLLAAISGAARSLGLGAYNGLSFADIPMDKRNDANTLNSVMQNLAQGMGVSFVSIIIAMSANFVAVDIAYRICFGFLALLVLYPIIQTIRLPESIGKSTL
jgi:EmrB/QacA subfamily drug resistance transporter